jgi:peptidoglycan/xylan/chitin deacetylase (PgdA/CDA1 family)
VRDTIADGLWRTQLTQPRRHDRFTILTFHRVLPQTLRASYPHPGLAVTPEELAYLLDFFGRHFELATVSEAYARFRSGERLGRPWAAISFDDGQWDNYNYAAPLLEERGLRASFFVPTQSVGTSDVLWHDEVGFGVLELAVSGERLPELGPDQPTPPAGHDPDATCQWAKTLDPGARTSLIEALRDRRRTALPEWTRLMSFQEVRELAARGHEIGSHSVTHALLPQLDGEALRRELLESKQVLETELASTVPAFCYPNGSQDARVRAATRAAGYDIALCTRWGSNAAGHDPWALKRCDMYSTHLRDSRGQLSIARVALRLSGLQPNLR